MTADPSEFVTRATFAAMVAERDAAVHLYRLELDAGNKAHAARLVLEAERDALAADRDRLERNIDKLALRMTESLSSEARLSAQLAAAHGLQSRAEAAEAECLRLRAECARVAEVEGRRHD